MKNRLIDLKTVGFSIKPNAPEIAPIFNDIKTIFETHGIKVFLSASSDLMIAQKDGVMEFDEMCQEADFLVSLGGDGTLLSLVRKSYKYHKPVFGINAGNLGFLADIKIEEVNECVLNLLKGAYRIDERMMIEGYIVRDGEKKTFYALNDVVITRPTISKMVKIDALIDGIWFNTYRGDGLIIATPTGSTAYNLAAGGPIIYPLTKAFIMTPISAHSLTQRPLVVPFDFTITLKSPKDTVVIMIDGQDDYEMHSGDALVIKGASIGARLIHQKEQNYFAVLKEKLSWGDKE